VKNITVSIPDEVYRAARIAAAERGTSVSALVKEHLQELTMGEDVQAPARRKLLEALEEVGRRHPGFRAADNLPRDELYDRGLH
jgi:plasmid stability protein